MLPGEAFAYLGEVTKHPNDASAHPGEVMSHLATGTGRECLFLLPCLPGRI